MHRLHRRNSPCLHCLDPILRRPPMLRRERPLVDLGDKLVLRGIGLNIIDVRREIVGVGDDLLPEAALPYPPFAGAAARGRDPPSGTGGARSRS